jgi:thiol-disulfide isomerase/thioredoxin
MRGALCAAVAWIALASCAPLPPPRLVHHATRAEASLEELRGKVVLLNFWATWCGPCIHEIPVLVRLAEEMRGRVLVVAVYYKDEEVGRPIVERWIARNPPGFAPHIAYGNEGLHRRFPHQGIPTTYVLDGNGVVVERVTGALTLERARRLVERALPP